MSAIPDDVMKASWEALFGSNIVRTPQRKLLVIAAANAILAERERCRAETLEAAAKVAADYCWNRYRAGGVLKSPAVFNSHTRNDIAAAIRALGGDHG